MLDIYKDPIKANEIQHVAEVNAGKVHTLDSNILCADQKWDIPCKQLASQSHHSNKNTSNTSNFCRWHSTKVTVCSFFET